MMIKARSELRWAMAAVVLLAMFGAVLAVLWVERRLENALEVIAIGDRYLQTFAVAVKGVLRLGDILSRYGGDEVAFFPPVTEG